LTHLASGVIDKLISACENKPFADFR
jgi:hypothetical protein